MHAGEQLMLIYGLVQEFIGATHDPVDTVLVAVEAREQYDGDQSSLRIRLDRLTNFKST